MNDLERVGVRKPLGYLPLDEVEDPRGLMERLESRGLTVVVLGEGDCHVRSGAMLAYERLTLSTLLASRRDVLEHYGWPSDPDLFARHQMTHSAPYRSALYDLVADAYGDYTNPFRSDSPVRSSRRRAFGRLKPCSSPLF